MLNYYTSHNHLARRLNSALLTIVLFMLALSFANGQACPTTPSAGYAGISLADGATVHAYPSALPTGITTGRANATYGAITHSGAKGTATPLTTVTIHPQWSDGTMGWAIINLYYLSIASSGAVINIYDGVGTSTTPVATITEANASTYYRYNHKNNGPITVTMENTASAATGNFDVGVLYMTGEVVYTSALLQEITYYKQFITPNSRAFVDSRAGSASTIATGYFDANRDLVSSEISWCVDYGQSAPRRGNFYPGGLVYNPTARPDMDQDGTITTADKLKTARLIYILQHVPQPITDIANSSAVVLAIDQITHWNGSGGLAGDAIAAIPSLPSPEEPTFSITGPATPVSAGSAQNFVVNLTNDGGYTRIYKLKIPAGVTVNSVTGSGVTYDAANQNITFASAPASATVSVTSSTSRTATVGVAYEQPGFWNVDNLIIYEPCDFYNVTGRNYQGFLGLSKAANPYPFREASGTWADVDYGDLPNTYATASASNGPSHAITAYNATAHTSSLMLGSQIDSEADGVAGTVANGDNLAGVNDEDAIKQFPVLPLGQTNYSVTVPVTNTTGATATVKGWIDFNRDGTFGTGEEATQTVADGGTSVTLTWPSFTAAATAGTVYARFRIASLASEITSPTGAASSGEVEDYRLFIGVTVAGTVFNDVNSNRIINSGENFTSLPAPMYVYMVNSNIIVDEATVGANGSYLLSAPANGTSTVHLSTQQYAIGTDIGTSAIDHTPPTNWKTTGENAGGNNNATTNDSNADGILSVTVTNVNLVNRNFGIRLLTAGTSGGYDICASDRSVMPLSDFISGQDLGGTWSYVSGSGITFDAVAGTVQLTSSATTSTYRYDLGGSFSIATVRVRQLPVKTQSITICEGQSYCLTNPVGNARVIAPNQTYCHTTGGVYTDTLSLAGQYGCDSIVVTTLTVIPTPNAGTDGATTACTNSTTPINLFSLITGEQTGGIWVRTSGTGGTFNAGAGTFTPAVGATTSTFSYTVTGANSCGTDVSVATVTLNACAVQISGTVFNDANGLDGIPANTVDGTPIQSAGSAPLYANLFTAAGTFVASVPVNASGNYSFTVTTGTDYLVTVSSTAAVTGSTPAGSVGLPGGWVNTGEFVGTGAGSDPAPNGILAVSVGTSSITDVNFGLDREPNSNNVTHILPTQPVTNTEIILDGTDAPLMNGSDLEDGTYTGNTGTVNNPQGVVITSLPTNGELWYYGFGVPVMVSAADVTNGTLFADPSLFTIILTGTGYTSTSFNYAYVDAAGVVDPTPATYTISWGKPLPVTLVGFDAKLENNIARLSWSTTDEINSDYFEVQHSPDAKNWTALGKVAAAGESSVKKNYTYDHVNLSSGTHYYRLKMADRDGTFALSTIRSLKLENAARVSLYPNPASNHFFLKDLDPSQVKSVKVFNLAGLVVKENEGVFSEQGMEINLAEGLYVVQVKKTDGSVEVFKLAVKK